ALSERPEERTFDHPQLRAYVLQNRRLLVAAGLTILRAYIAAGSPAIPGLKPLGRYEDWDTKVRSPLRWIGLADPVASREKIVIDDSDRSNLEALLVLWRDSISEPLTSRELVERASGA